MAAKFAKEEEVHWS